MKISALVFASILSLTACGSALRLAPSDADVVLAQHTLSAPDPGQRGDYPVGTFTYGSGTDRRRPEYGDSVTLRTESVDASKLMSLGESADDRNDYWGFTPEEFPINGRVWYPDGPGPFPLVLVVHGNHNMRDYSDPGYDYLGELLASRGFILASVDMNFVNGTSAENDARGWLLLEHLRAWRRIGEEEGSPVRGRVDMSNIALMGHSRGGEAVGHAAAFNRLKHYPDDASLTFDFGFDLKALVAIAPVDGQYRPSGVGVPVEDVSYLVFHGSHDGDVTSFNGLRQYHRVTFSEGSPHFKAAIYVYRANHGQWNTVWGARDRGPRSARTLDLRGLLDPLEQRRFAEIFVSAFLEATLKGDRRWLPLFRDHRVIGRWLPPTQYVTRFQDATFRPLASFEEDIDLTSGTEKGVTLRGDSLATWKEATLQLRSTTSQEVQAAWLAWNNRIAGRDTSRVGPPARFVVTLPPELPGRWQIGPRTSVELLLSATDRTPPRRPSPDSAREQRGDSAAAPRSERDEQSRDEDEDDEDDEEDVKPPLDLTVEVEDVSGVSARVALSSYGPIRRPLETRILRRADQEAERYPQLSEIIPQSYSIPLSDFLATSAGLDLSRLREVRLVFDRSDAGEVVLDQVGLAWLEDASWAARVRAPTATSATPR